MEGVSLPSPPHPRALIAFPQAHDAPILQLAWSHPEHSSLLASCSYDRSVRIWEQVAVPYGSGGGRPQVGGTQGKRWVECALLMDARGSVRNVEFAPNAFGLKIVGALLPLSLCDVLTVRRAGDDIDGFVFEDIYLSLPVPRRLAVEQHRFPPRPSTRQEQRRRAPHRTRRHRDGDRDRKHWFFVRPDGLNESVEWAGRAESGKGE